MENKFLTTVMLTASMLFVILSVIVAFQKRQVDPTPTMGSTEKITVTPTIPIPTDTPPFIPTTKPTTEITIEPTDMPTPESTDEPTTEPTDPPTPESTKEPTSEPSPTPEAVVKVDNLNLRSGPGIEYPVKGSLSMGAILNIIGRVAGNNGWIKVASADLGLEGWVSALSEYIQIKGDLNSVQFVDAPPLPIPTPIPYEAMVIASNGIELRCGPGKREENDYDTIIILPQGTPLDVLRRVYLKDDWIKVAVKMDSITGGDKVPPTICDGYGKASVLSETGDSIEGWVNKASGDIEVNINLDEILPMYEYGPKLLNPIKFAEGSLEGPIDFAWEPVPYPLGDYQIYSLILVRDDLKDKDSCYHWQVKEPKVTLNEKDLTNCTPGDYHWGVGLATNLAEEGAEPIWQDDSEFDERNPIGIGVPHSQKPKGTGSGGNGSVPVPDDPNPPPD